MQAVKCGIFPYSRLKAARWTRPALMVRVSRRQGSAGLIQALAVPAGAQTCRQTEGRLAVRLPAPASQIGQRSALLQLRLRPARIGRATGLAWLHLARPTLNRRCRTPRLPPRAADGTGITVAIPVDGLVLSGVRTIVLSGAQLSCYQEYESPANPMLARVSTSRNSSNLIHLTNSRGALPRWITAEIANRKPKQPGFSRRKTKP